MVIKANEQTFAGKVTDATGTDANALKGMTVAVYKSSDASAAKISKDVTTFNNGTFTVVSKAGYVKVTDPNGVYTFAGAETSALADAIKANEQTYTGTVTDADGEAIMNANITVKVVDAKGMTVGSVATVDKDGSYKIITSLTLGKKVMTVDADGTRTFDDVTITSSTDMPAIKSNQYTLKGTVKTLVDPGETGKAIKDITVTLSLYSATVDPVVVKTAVTDKNGAFSFLVDKKDGYGVVATDSGIYRFSAGPVMYTTGYTVAIVTEYKIAEMTVTDADSPANALAGIKVTVSKDTMTVGEYTTDKDGKFSYPEMTGIKYKAVDPNGVYTFADNSLVAKEKTFTVSVKANFNGMTDAMALSGVTVNFIDTDKKIVKTVVTDAEGAASAILKSDTYTYKAVDGTTMYGAMTFGAESAGVIMAKEKVYSGYYANGDVVSGVVVTYQISDAGMFKEKGKAVVIDNMYYIATAVSSANSIRIDANAEKFYATATFNSMATVGTTDLIVTERTGVVTVPTGRGFGSYYYVYNHSNAQVGDKIILSAKNVVYEPLEPGNDTTVVKYKFCGWYVNGVKVSDELEYTYTVTESCVVYADYKVSSYETAPSEGMDSTVLIIGIAAVIIALIAVVYAVVQKRE